MKIKGSLVTEYGFAIGVSMLLAILIRVFLVEAFKVPTSVMRPNLLPGDYIFASKISYGVKIPMSREYLFRGADPKYGDVVVYESNQERENLIKRVVGLSGDVVEMKKGHLLVNGNLSKFEPGKTASCGHEYHPKKGYNICVETPLPTDIQAVKVPENSIYVMADFRSQSGPRRKVGELISISSVKAKAMFIWLSVSPKLETDGVGFFPQIRFERILKEIE